MAIVDAAICFFIPFYATRPNGQHSATDVFSVGKTVFTALLGTVTLEVRSSEHTIWACVHCLSNPKEACAKQHKTQAGRRHSLHIEGYLSTPACIWNRKGIFVVWTCVEHAGSSISTLTSPRDVRAGCLTAHTNASVVT